MRYKDLEFEVGDYITIHDDKDLFDPEYWIEDLRKHFGNTYEITRIREYEDIERSEIMVGEEGIDAVYFMPSDISYVTPGRYSVTGFDFEKFSEDFDSLLLSV